MSIPRGLMLTFKVWLTGSTVAFGEHAGAVGDVEPHDPRDSMAPGHLARPADLHRVEHFDLLAGLAPGEVDQYVVPLAGGQVQRRNLHRRVQ